MAFQHSRDISKILVQSITEEEEFHKELASEKKKWYMLVPYELLERHPNLKKLMKVSMNTFVQPHYVDWWKVGWVLLTEKEKLHKKTKKAFEMEHKMI